MVFKNKNHFLFCFFPAKLLNCKTLANCLEKHFVICMPVSRNACDSIIKQVISELVVLGDNFVFFSFLGANENSTKNVH